MSRPLPPVYFLLSIVAMILLHLALPVRRLIPMWWNLSGIVPLVAGIAIAVVANRLFARRGTAIHPFAEATTLVTDGPFRYSRNPMYLGMVMVLAGIALLEGSLTPWLVIPPFAWILSRQFIRVEQRALEQRFGADYIAYKKRVRRWL